MKNNFDHIATVTLYDNDEAVHTAEYELCQGSQMLTMTHTLETYGMHELTFSIEVAGEVIHHSNDFVYEITVASLQKILIVESEQGSSEALITMLNETNDSPYEITTMLISDEFLPTTAERLNEYDQIILNDIANAHLQEKSDEIGYDFALELQAFVAEYGGSLFTLGGENAYDRADMRGTAYQEMLPVQAIDYTPPVAVMVIIDTSGSMSAINNYGETRLECAKAGAMSCLDSLTERDYMGVMTLDDVASMLIDLTPRTQEARICNAINQIEEANGGTIWTGALDRAGKALRALKNVAKRHIIVITDGASGEDPSNYEHVIKEFYEQGGITLSVVGIDMATSGSEYDAMKQATEWGGGALYVTSASQLINKLREDLMSPAIKKMNYQSFQPTILPKYEIVYGISQSNIPTLNGFYGTKLKENANAVLTGDYNVPIYAYWQYGKGFVGSFACDLQASEWSSAFMADANGKTLIRNLIAGATPSKYTVSQTSNYKEKPQATISIIETLRTGEKITLYLKNSQGEDLQTIEILDIADLENAHSFFVKSIGEYVVTLIKEDENGNTIAQSEYSVRITE